ncbi:MAG: DUF4231 domain-containing protein [Saprospirales bacterium]|nr:DUF4231 domain-containing protein [Saprospirales bacterium]MBK8922984.1 DUF4231 domain-containing protein [Saprospirales bacterium]
MASNAEWKQQSEKYITDRIQDQISWYERKSRINKTGYYRCRYLIIGSGALIPLLVGYAEGWFDWLKYVAGFLGVVVAVSEGIMSLKKFLENWSTYRLTAERLRRELYFYENMVGDDYAPGGEPAFKKFVLRAEQVMASENEEWKSYIETTQEQK